MENNKNQKTIYVDEKEEVIEIIDKIKQYNSKDIVLLVPDQSLLFQSLINLKLLKNKAEELGKIISIVKVGRNDLKPGTNHFVGGQKTKIKAREENGKESLKINGENSPDSESLLRTADSSINLYRNFQKNPNGQHRVRMFDIVKRIKDINCNEPKLAEEKTKSANYIKTKEPYVLQKDRREITERTSFLREREENKRKISHLENQRKRITILPSISSKFYILFILAGIIIVISALFFVFSSFILPMFFKADIHIILEPKTTNYELEVFADESADYINIEQRKIPVKKIEVNSEETESYPTTGKKHITSKASGEITVFNEYSSNSQKIVSGTRFLSKEGHLFRIKDLIVIPGFSRIEGNDIPGQITVMVYADQPGEKYNIEPTSFTIPGLQGSAKYSSVYARSFKLMTGGMDKEASYLTEGDYITAKKNLVEKIKNKSNQDFLDKISSEDIVLEDIKQEKNIEIKCDIDIGDVADNFKMTVLSGINALVVKRTELDDLIGEKMKSELESGKKLVDGSIDYKIENATIGEDGIIAINISVGYSSIKDIDIDKTKSEILNKNESELKEYFKNIEGIKSTDINIWPYWINNIPSSYYDRINIIIDTNISM